MGLQPMALSLLLPGLWAMGARAGRRPPLWAGHSGHVSAWAAGTVLGAVVGLQHPNSRPHQRQTVLSESISNNTQKHH